MSAQRRERPSLEERRLKAARAARNKIEELVVSIISEPCPECGQRKLEAESTYGGIVISCAGVFCRWKPWLKKPKEQK